MSEPDPFALLDALGMAVLERKADCGFRAWGPLPAWFDEALDGGADGLVQFTDLPFLENFLIDAESLWERPQAGQLRSGIWSHASGAGGELFLEAFALTLENGCRLLCIQRRDQSYREFQGVLQRARETTLSLESLRREIQQKEVLLHFLVHDLRAPLTGIVGALSLLLARQLPPEQARSLLEMGLTQARKQDSMIREVLNVFSAEIAAASSFETDPVSAPDAARVVAEACDSFRAAYDAQGVSLALEDERAEDGAVHVVGREDRLERVLANLLQNALRHSPPDSTVRVVLADAGQDVELRIEDEGSGVSESLRESLFERFTKGEGTRGVAGLGLYFCRINVQQWGGSIGYTPAAGGGSVFWFRLPKAV